MRLDRSVGWVERLIRILSDDEQQRAARFCFEPDATRFVVGRAALRTILGEHLGIDPDTIRLTYGPQGRPELAPPFDATGLRFSLSRSESLGLCAVTRGQRIGVDVERVRPLPDMEAIAERMFLPRERRAIRRLPEPRRPQAFFERWTRMEAYGKALGEGIAGSVERERDAAAAAVGRWSLEAFVPDPGYVAAIAVEGRISRLICRSWPGVNARLT